MTSKSLIKVAKLDLRRFRQRNKRQRKLLGAKPNEAVIIAGSTIIFMDAKKCEEKFFGGVNWQKNH